MGRKGEYEGFTLAELLQLEVELCTPLRRAEWFRSTKDANPMAIRAALLSDVHDRCKEKGLVKNQLAELMIKRRPAKLSDGQWEHRLYGHFYTDRFPKNNLTSWRISKDLLRCMLVGTNVRDSVDRRHHVAESIVRYFFTTDLKELPPPFFNVERTDSHFCGWPHDEAESRFYMVSLAMDCHDKRKDVRWFLASGGDLFHGLKDEKKFSVWAERLTAALCFGLKFTLLVPEPTQGNESPSHEFIERLNQYWKTIDADLDKTDFAGRYPDLQHLITEHEIGTKAQQSFNPVQVPMSEARMIDHTRLNETFSVDAKGGTRKCTDRRSLIRG